MNAAVVIKCKLVKIYFSANGSRKVWIRQGETVHFTDKE